jgi:hypothetical protein
MQIKNNFKSFHNENKKVYKNNIMKLILLSLIVISGIISTFKISSMGDLLNLNAIINTNKDFQCNFDRKNTKSDVWNNLNNNDNELFSNLINNFRVNYSQSLQKPYLKLISVYSISKYGSDEETNNIYISSLGTNFINYEKKQVLKEITYQDFLKRNVCSLILALNYTENYQIQSSIQYKKDNLIQKYKQIEKTKILVELNDIILSSPDNLDSLKNYYDLYKELKEFLNNY